MSTSEERMGTLGWAFTSLLQFAVFYALGFGVLALFAQPAVFLVGFYNATAVAFSWLATSSLAFGLVNGLNGDFPEEALSVGRAATNLQTQEKLFLLSFLVAIGSFITSLQVGAAAIIGSTIATQTSYPALAIVGAVIYPHIDRELAARFNISIGFIGLKIATVVIRVIARIANISQETADQAVEDAGAFVGVASHA
jgi:hypothetical protein